MASAVPRSVVGAALAQPIDADVAAFAHKLQLRECPAQHLVLVDEQERESAALLLDERETGARAHRRLAEAPFQPSEGPRSAFVLSH
jgi:hypothetical protein